MSAQDIAIIIGAIASACVLIIGALGAVYVKIHSVGQSVNGRVDELVAAARAGGFMEGRMPDATPQGSATEP